MTSFIKTNKLVEELTSKYQDKSIKEISIVFNTHRIHTSEFGKYIKPICIIIEFDSEEKDKIENPDYFFNLPQSLDYIIDLVREQYAAILINPNEPQTYKENSIYYNRALAVIRNPKTVNELKEIENKTISFIEYSF